MPASVAATGWCFMKSSTNSSLSAVNVRMVSIMRGLGPGRSERDGESWGAWNPPYSIGFPRGRLDPGPPKRRARTGGPRPRRAAGPKRTGPANARGPAPDQRCCERPGLGSNLGDVRCLLALGPRHEVELDPFALCERTEAGRADRREVDEHVLSAVRGDEAEALGIVEPLHRALHAAFGGTGRSRD